MTWGTMFVLASGLSYGICVVGIALLFTLAVLATFFRFRGWPFYPGRIFRLIVLRPFWYLQLILPVITIAGLAGMLAGAIYGMIARDAVAITSAVSAGRMSVAIVASCFALFLAAGYIGSRRLRVRHITIHVPSLPQEFDGFRIAQISDLHVGPHLPWRALSRMASVTQSVNADMIAVTGDLVDDRSEDAAVYARWFGNLRAPSGVFAIAGNHDVYAGWPETEAALRQIDGLTVLVNASHIITRGNASIAVVGTGDPAASGRNPFRLNAGNAAPNMRRAFAEVPPDTMVIALAHNPVLWPELVQRGVAVTLSGHTHWGQLALPRFAWSAASPFLTHAMGLYREDRSVLYVHPGTGYWGLPFRLGATAEVAVIELRR